MVRKLKKKDVFISPTLKKVSENEYLITFPESADKLIKKHFDAVEKVENEQVAVAYKELNEIIKVMKGHFASYNLLIDITLGAQEPGLAAKLYNAAEKDTKNILNAIGQDEQISWDYSQNREFLKFMYNLGVRCLAGGNLKKAETIFRKLLVLNPSDNQDVKEVLVDTLFDQKKYDEVVAISKAYDHSKNAAMIFNEVLCHFIAGRLDEAKVLLADLTLEAQDVFNKLEEAENKSEEDTHGFIPLSVIQNKALFYWENFFEYWNEHDGALEFLKNNAIISEESKSITYEIVSDIESCSLESFNTHLIEKDLKETTVKDHMENIAIFSEVLTSKEATLEKIITFYKSGITKSKLNKTVTTLNQFFRFAVEDKAQLKEILSDMKTLKEGLLNS